MRVRQLSKTSGTSSANLIKSKMKTISSEAICMIETWKMEQEFYYTKKMHMRGSSDKHFARSLRIAATNISLKKVTPIIKLLNPKPHFVSFSVRNFN